MSIGFSEALLLLGGLLAVAAALSGWLRASVLNVSVLAVAAGLVLAGLDVVSIDSRSDVVEHSIELALILTLFADGLLVERELLGRHWGPAARALIIAMPVTMGLLALCAKLIFPELDWAECFLLGAILAPTDPVVTSTVVTTRRVPALIRHTLEPRIRAQRRTGAAAGAVLPGARRAGRRRRAVRDGATRRGRRRRRDGVRARLLGGLGAAQAARWWDRAQLRGRLRARPRAARVRPRGCDRSGTA